MFLRRRGTMSTTTLKNDVEAASPWPREPSRREKNNCEPAASRVGNGSVNKPMGHLPPAIELNVPNVVRFSLDRNEGTLRGLLYTGTFELVAVNEITRKVYGSAFVKNSAKPIANTYETTKDSASLALHTVNEV
jgi:hypothetical protein